MGIHGVKGVGRRLSVEWKALLSGQVRSRKDNVDNKELQIQQERDDSTEGVSQTEKERQTTIPDIWSGTALPRRRCYIRAYWSYSSSYFVFLGLLREELPPGTGIVGYQRVVLDYENGTRFFGYRVLLWPPEGERLYPDCGEDCFDSLSLSLVDRGITGVVCDQRIWCSYCAEKVEDAVRWITEWAAKDRQDDYTVGWFTDGIR